MTVDLRSIENKEEYLKVILGKIHEMEEGSDYSQYADDPAGFIEEVLGETLTDDLRKVCDSVAKHEVTIAQSGNGTGKSWISAHLTAWFFVCRHKPQAYSAAAPPESNLKNIIWAELGSVVSSHPELFSGCKVTDMRIERDSLQFATGVTIPTSGTDKTKEARFSGKHAPSLFFTVDEADAVPDAIFNGIETCTSGGYQRLLCMFNPRQRMGAVYRKIKNGEANVVKLTAFNHPNVITGENKIPGAVDRPTTVRRIAQWTRPLAPGETKDKRCFELPVFLEGCVPIDQKGDALPALVPGTYRIIENQFSHVVLGEYPSQADNQLISEEWLDKARSRYDLYVAEHGEKPPEHVRCVAGGDVAEQGADLSCLAKRYGNLLLPVKKYEGEMDVLTVGDYFIRDLQQDNVGSIQVDGTGVGSGVAPHLQRKNHPGVTVKVAKSPTERTELGEFRILRDQLLWAYREWLRTEQAMLPPDAELLEESLVLTYEVKNGKINVMSTDAIKDLLKRSPDTLMSVVMTFHSTGKFSGLDLS